MQTEVVLCLGGNKGDREKLLSRAIESLDKYFDLIQVSSVYETEAWGGVAKGKFLNQLAVISTSQSASELLEIIQTIETKLGRRREEPWGDRTMDIDILYYGDQVIKTDRLIIPHPFIDDRKFVLIPLLEILPQKKHPETGMLPSEMLAKCDDTSEVNLYKPHS